MKKIKSFIFYITIITGIALIVSFNLAIAENNINFQSLIDALKNLIYFQKNTQTKIESSEEIFQQIPEYKPVADYEKLIVTTVEKASPSVVSIVISKDVPVFEKYYINPFEEFDLPPEFKQFFFEFEIPQYKQKGTEKKKIGAGTGFIISSDGLIATNKHVVDDKDAEYTVYLNDGRKFKGRVLAIHPVDDLAIIKINANNLPYLQLGDSDKLKLGQTVIAIGNALGEFQNTVSVGVVSGLRRNIVASDNYGNVEKLEGLIQTDAAINPGNSGGPLINLRGEVIGINTAIVSGAQNIGFAIPVNRLKNMLYDLQTKGKIEVPFLGIRYLLITEEVQKKFNLPVDYGAYVYSDDPNKPAVIPGSPADKVGIKNGDIILELDGNKITPQNSLAQQIRSRKVGDKIKLKILRGKETLTLEVQLENLPSNLKD